MPIMPSPIHNVSSFAIKLATKSDMLVFGRADNSSPLCSLLPPLKRENFGVSFGTFKRCGWVEVRRITYLGNDIWPIGFVKDDFVGFPKNFKRISVIKYCGDKICARLRVRHDFPDNLQVCNGEECDFVSFLYD